MQEELAGGNKNFRNIFLGALALVVVLILLGGWYFFLRKDVEVIAPGTELTRARAGRVISDFPREFILEPQAVVEESYSINYSNEGIRYPVVRYRSSRNLAQNVADFRRILDEGEWVIYRRASAGETPITFFYATKGEAKLNVSFETREDGLFVNVSYAAPE